MFANINFILVESFWSPQLDSKWHSLGNLFWKQCIHGTKSVSNYSLFFLLHWMSIRCLLLPTCYYLSNPIDPLTNCAMITRCATNSIWILYFKTMRQILKSRWRTFIHNYWNSIFFVNRYRRLSWPQILFECRLRYNPSTFGTDQGKLNAGRSWHGLKNTMYIRYKSLNWYIDKTRMQKYKFCIYHEM